MRSSRTAKQSWLQNNTSRSATTGRSSHEPCRAEATILKNLPQRLSPLQWSVSTLQHLIPNHLQLGIPPVIMLVDQHDTSWEIIRNVPGAQWEVHDCIASGPSATLAVGFVCPCSQWHTPSFSDFMHGLGPDTIQDTDTAAFSICECSGCRANSVGNINIADQVVKIDAESCAVVGVWGRSSHKR